MRKSFSTQFGVPATYLKKLTSLRYSVVFRLTVWYAGLFTTTLLSAFLAFYLVILHNSHGMSHHAVDEIKEDLVHYFGVPIGIVIVLSSVGGWLMARRALAGVNEIREAAIEISHGDLDRRVPLTGRRDEIDQLAETFNEMVSRVQALIGQMKEITENIAHDLRSPITRMRGVAELVLLEKSEDEEQTAMAGTIVEECDRLLSMINTMLDISEAEAGLAKLRPEETDLMALLIDLCDLYQPLAEDRQVALSLEGPHTLPLACDRAKLQRVFANLLDNALKYTQPGGRVEIAVSESDDDAEVIVSDTGTGITDEDLSHIFDRFYRGEKSRSEPGNGLGLSLAQAFVLLHGGAITARSRIGQGSQFVVTLPKQRHPSHLTKR
jgi:signal transduction histidine kinase